MSKFKFKNLAQIDRIVLTVAVTAEERIKFLNEWQKPRKKDDPLTVEYEGKEYVVCKVHPTQTKEELRLTVSL